MGKFQGNYFGPGKYREAYIAATQRVERARNHVEGVKARMMLGDVEDYAELEIAQEELEKAKIEADRLHCLWTTGTEPGAAAGGDRLAQFSGEGDRSWIGKTHSGIWIR